MHLPLRLAAALVLTVLALYGLGRALSHLGLGDFSGVLEELARERQREVDLVAKMRAAEARSEARSTAAARLAAGHLEFAEAVARFREIGEDTPRFGDGLSEAESGATVEERLCRHVIGWAVQDLRHDPERQATLIARLEGEMQVFLAQVAGAR